MTLMQKIKSNHKEVAKRGEERGIKLGEKRGTLKAVELMEQGYKPAEIKEMLLASTRRT